MRPIEKKPLPSPFLPYLLCTAYQPSVGYIWNEIERTNSGIESCSNVDCNTAHVDNFVSSVTN